MPVGDERKGRAAQGLRKTGEHGDTPHMSFPRRRESSPVASVLYINVQEVPI